MRVRRRRDSALTRLVGWFGRGLLVFVPTIGTLYTVWLVLAWLDERLGLSIPGSGLLVTVVLITLVGFLASNVVGQAAVLLFERGLSSLPLVSLLYTSIKDLLGAFVGDKKSFDRPVMVKLDADGAVKVFGFVTCQRFDDPRLADHVAVYLPQSYNFAGNLVIVPTERIEPVDAVPAQFMAFIVSGGVSDMSAARTVYEAETTSTSGHG